jgi:hypothetical protein
MIDGADDDDDDDKVSQVVGKLIDKASRMCKPSIGDSGGGEKFRRGPGLVSPRRSQQDDEAGGFDVRDASGRHGDVTPDVKVCRRRRSSQPLQSAGAKSRKK